jgi:hypothetical protein
MKRMLLPDFSLSELETSSDILDFSTTNGTAAFDF